MYMDKGLDTGDMIIKREIEIGENETAGELHDRLMELGALALLDTITILSKGTVQRIPQNDEEATYAPIMTKSLGRIDWSKSAGEIRNLIRGTYPWPGAFSSYNGKIFKLLSAAVLNNNIKNVSIGSVSQVNRDNIVINCGIGSLRIEELQFENEKRMSVEAYLRGHEIATGVTLGE
jgi:methionyl-tRNA formyltransferase